MKLYWITCLLWATNIVQAQKNIALTEAFTIEGKIKHVITFKLQDATGYKSITIDSLIILNHLLERKSALHNIKGILLKDVLSKTEIVVDNPKLLSEFYFVCMATDSYKVVFSWNELFNTDVGNQVVIITSVDGVSQQKSDNRIAIVCTADQATGRRYVKGLQKIVVERAN